MQKKTHCIRNMNATGDTEHRYDPNDPAQLKAAAELYDSIRRSGHMTYALGEDNKGTVIRSFDPTAEIIVAHKNIVGG